MGESGLSLGLVFVAGLLSFFSPCVLPLVPVYLGYLTGGSVTGLTTTKRSTLMGHALFFVAGFGAIFVALGATAALMGQLVARHHELLVRGGGILLIVLGMNMAGLIRLPWLNFQRRFSSERPARGAWGASFLMGLIFAAGWTPCVGPVLSGALILAADAQTVARGSLLLGVYALGLGVPFVAVAGAVNALLPWLRRLGRHSRWISVISGILLIALGFVLLTDLYGVLFGGLSLLADLSPGVGGI